MWSTSALTIVCFSSDLALFDWSLGQTVLWNSVGSQLVCSRNSSSTLTASTPHMTQGRLGKDEWQPQVCWSNGHPAEHWAFRYELDPFQLIGVIFFSSSFHHLETRCFLPGGYLHVLQHSPDEHYDWGWKSTISHSKGGGVQYCQLELLHHDGPWLNSSLQVPRASPRRQALEFVHDEVCCQNTSKLPLQHHSPFKKMDGNGTSNGSMTKLMRVGIVWCTNSLNLQFCTSSIALWQILREESWKINKISDEYIWIHTYWLLYLIVYCRISMRYCILDIYTHHSQDNPNRHRRQDSPRPVMGLIAAATAASRSFSVLNEARVWDAAGDILHSIRYWLEKTLRKSHRPKKG